MNNWAVPKRYFKLTLYAGRDPSDQREVKVLSTLNIDSKVQFDTSASVSGSLNEANIQITGLKRSTMLYLATCYNQYNRILNHVVIDAGYENNHGVVFEGNIVQAIPNLNNADYSISLKAVAGFENLLQGNPIIAKAGKVAVGDILREIALDNGLVLRNTAKPVYIENYSDNGEGVGEKIRRIAEMTGLNIYIDGKTLNCNPYDKSNERSSFTVSYRNMIGSPKPTPIGCEVDLRMCANLQSGTMVKINSLKFPTLGDNSYFVQTIAHRGDTKGNDWVSHVYLIREGFEQYANESTVV